MVPLLGKSAGARRRWRARTSIGVGLVAALLAGTVVVHGAAGLRAHRPSAPNSGRLRVRLKPVEIPGPWWRRHRHWLRSPMPFAGARPIIVNARTGAAYRWVFKGNRDGHGWFGVGTRWTWVHPAWKDDPWVLLYDGAAG